MKFIKSINQFKLFNNLKILIEMESKKKQILETLKSKPFSQQKSSERLINLIQKQRIEHNKKEQDKMYSLLMKQHNVLTILDEQNQALVEQNDLLHEQIDSNQQLVEQNQSLKQQLLISQSNCAKMVNELNKLKRSIKLKH